MYITYTHYYREDIIAGVPFGLVVFEGLLDRREGVGVQLQAVIQARPNIQVGLLVPEEVLDVAPDARDVGPHELDRDEAELRKRVSAQAVRGRLEGARAEAVAEVRVDLSSFLASILDKRVGGRGLRRMVWRGDGVREEEEWEGDKGEERKLHYKSPCMVGYSVFSMGDKIVGRILQSGRLIS